MKKRMIIFLSVVVICFICVPVFNSNWKCFFAEMFYGGMESQNSDIYFSKKSGFYDKEFYLKIYAPSDEIYYTLDGTEPTKSSLKYEGSILIQDASLNENQHSMRTDVCGSFLAEDTTYSVPNELIDKCTVLKAVYYDKNGTWSGIEERVFFVGFHEKEGYDNINIISITTDPDNLFDENQGIYVLGNSFKEFRENNDLTESNWYRWEANYLNRGQEWEREATIHVFDETKNLELKQNVGIRIQGGVSRGLYPKSLNIYAREIYGSNEMLYDFFDTGYYPQRVTLSSGGNDYYGKMRDRLGAELTEDCEFCTMNYEPYALFLNGEYWGFYYLTEKYDEHYIEHYYDVDKDNVIIIKNDKIEAGTEEDKEAYDQMKQFVENADMTLDENYQIACTMFDMQSFVDYFAAEIYMARTVDWPSSNYALWRSREVSEKPYEDGKWRWMLFDVNTSALSDHLVDHDTLAWVIQGCQMFANLWSNSSFREMFTETLLEMSENIFEPELVKQKVLAYENLMMKPMDKHYQRFFGGSIGTTYPTTESILEFIDQRADYIPGILAANMPD